MRAESMVAKVVKVMFVDDDEHFLYLVRRVANRTNLVSDIVEAINGQDAIDQIEKMLDEDGDAQLPEILFTDLNMPVMDGFAFIDTLIERQSTEPRLQAIKKVVVLTSSSDPKDQARFEQQSLVTEYLVKQAASEMRKELERILIEHTV
ncbi:MAG: response regulator [Phycisphaeraceae bacterium]|nr:response regulator [Phycisphaeraceae bacterium]